MKKFNKALSVLCVVYGKDFTQELAKAYAMVLREYQEEDLVRAGMALAEGEFFPRPFDFIQILSPAKISVKDRADDAWNTIVAKSCGANGIVIEDPLTFKAMKGVCDQYMIARSNEFQLNNYQKRFTASYRVLAAADGDQDNLARIEGKGFSRIGAGHE